MVLTKEQVFKLYEAVGYVKNNWRANCPMEVQLLLRTFDNMTEEEKKLIEYEYDYIATSGKNIDDYLETEYKYQSLSQLTGVILYLLSIGIDLFGATDKGWAVRCDYDK